MIHNAWNSHYRLSFPRSSRLKAHRTLRDEEGFLVRHFAGAVCYNTVIYNIFSTFTFILNIPLPLQNQFIEKNNDALHASLECLVQESASPLLKVLFATSSSSMSRGKLNFISVGSKFKTQLGELMDKLGKNVKLN